MMTRSSRDRTKSRPCYDSAAAPHAAPSPAHPSACMTTDQVVVLVVLVGALGLFAWGRWRYDLVALFALLAVVLTGIVPVAEAFSGFAHPAVVTVVAVLVISRALQNAGVVDAVARILAPLHGRATLQVGAQTALAAALSAVMNNVGALALLIPVALRNAYRGGYSPARAMMPLAFGSLLGGLVTLIGTPPNIIVSTIRQEQLGAPFQLFDFAPVGGPIALVGVIFLAFLGWRLIPKARLTMEASKGFDVGAYLLEATVDAASPLVGTSIEDVESRLEDVRVVGLARDHHVRPLPPWGSIVQAGDLLSLQGEPETLRSAIAESGLNLVQSEKLKSENVRSDDIDIIEVIVKPGSPLSDQTPKSMRLRTVHRVNLLGVVRHGQRPQVRLRDLRFQIGDVLMLQGTEKDLESACRELDCIPLAERNLSLGQPRRLAITAGAFGAAVAMILVGLLPVHIAFVSAVVIIVVAGGVRLDEAYGAVDWPVIVLLGAMLPVGGALESTGGTDIVVDLMLAVTAGVSPVWALTLLLVTTMMLSDVINNNATAVLMAPIGLALASRLDANPDAFLMAVAVGASCAFLTPIGHQSNTLVLAPGGYRFGDYWRVGLPLELVIVAIAVPLLSLVWGLGR
jgi:di/tricarboxylate transporter